MVRRGRSARGWCKAAGIVLVFASLPLAFGALVASVDLDLGPLFDFDLERFFLPFAAFKREPGEISLRVVAPGEYGIWGEESGPVTFDLRDPAGMRLSVEEVPPGYRSEVWDAARDFAGEQVDFGGDLVALGRFVAAEPGTYRLRTGAAPPTQRITCIRTRSEGDPLFEAYAKQHRAAARAEADAERERRPGGRRIFARNALLVASGACLLLGAAIFIHGSTRSQPWRRSQRQPA